MAGRRSEAPRPPMIAQKTMIAVRLWATVIASAPIAYATRPTTYARLRPKRSPSLLLIRMNAAETRASSAIALWTELTFVSRSFTTAAIETFISDVSTTSTNIAAASTNGSRRLPPGGRAAPSAAASVTRRHRPRSSSFQPSSPSAQHEALGDLDDALKAKRDSGKHCEGGSRDLGPRDDHGPRGYEDDPFGQGTPAPLPPDEGLRQRQGARHDEIDRDREDDHYEGVTRIAHD